MMSNPFIEKWNKHVCYTFSSAYKLLSYFAELSHEEMGSIARIHAQELVLGQLLSKVNSIDYFVTLAEKNLCNHAKLKADADQLFDVIGAWIGGDVVRFSRLYNAGMGRLIKSYENYSLSYDSYEQHELALLEKLETSLIPMDTMYIITKRDIIEGFLTGHTLLPLLPFPDERCLLTVLDTDSRMRILLKQMWSTDPAPINLPEELIWYHPRSHWWWWITAGE